MATDAQAAAAYGRLKQYGSKVPSENVENFDIDVACGEEMQALSWFINDLLEYHADVPRDLLLESYALLPDEDKEEHKPLLDEYLAQHSA
jgi:hypothetical protein